MTRAPKVPSSIPNVPCWAVNSGDRPNGRAGTEKLWPSGGEFLRVSEAASHLNISEKTVRRLIAAGTVKTLRIGRLVRIPRREIERFVAAVSFSADTPKGAR